MGAPDALTNLLDGLFAVGAHAKVAAKPANLEREVTKDFRPVLRVSHFGMKLDTVVTDIRVLEGGDGRGVGARGQVKAFGKGLDPVAVGRPDLELGSDTFEERASVATSDHSVPVFTVLCRANVASQDFRHQLHPVAHTECRDAESEDLFLAVRSPFGIDAFRPPRQDDSTHVLTFELRRGGRKRQDLAVNGELSQAACDELGILGAEI